MNQEKYIGMDVHQATISVAVMDGRGKLIMECILETKAATILEFVRGLQGDLSVTFEEGTSAAWLHDLLKPSVITSKAANGYHFKTGQRDWPCGTENVLPCRLLWWQVGFGAPASRAALEHVTVVQ
jgi:hypothetical protein